MRKEEKSTKNLTIKRKPTAKYKISKCIICNHEMLSARKTKKTCCSKCRNKLRDPEKLREWQLANRKKNNLHARIRHSKLKKENPEKLKVKMKVKREKRIEKDRAYAIKYIQEHPEQVKKKK